MKVEIKSQQRRVRGKTVKEENAVFRENKTVDSTPWELRGKGGLLSVPEAFRHVADTAYRTCRDLELHKDKRRPRDALWVKMLQEKTETQQRQRKTPGLGSQRDLESQQREENRNQAIHQHGTEEREEEEGKQLILTIEVLTPPKTHAVFIHLSQIEEEPEPGSVDFRSICDEEQPVVTDETYREQKVGRRRACPPVAPIQSLRTMGTVLRWREYRIYANFCRKPLNVPQSVYDTMQTFLEFLLLVPEDPRSPPSAPAPHLPAHL
ncbi:hypothetical protein MG293_010470 [Ovis ammon polii]|uniref:Uncharacterized protein n=1 Tax=Ovis ammon polii TaxID=230172 RepID=A0AAD4U423_OVIAM|nr:hypothetical protein MG293_010470 [Ovis ammon polii]